jgi:hypothetical protein
MELLETLLITALALHVLSNHSAKNHFALTGNINCRSKFDPFNKLTI